MGCARHVQESSGVCAACVTESLNKQASSSHRDRFVIKSRLAEDYLRREAASSSRSAIRYGAAEEGARISNTIASLIKSDQSEAEGSRIAETRSQFSERRSSAVKGTRRESRDRHAETLKANGKDGNGRKNGYAEFDKANDLDENSREDGYAETHRANGKHAIGKDRYAETHRANGKDAIGKDRYAETHRANRKDGSESRGRCAETYKGNGKDGNGRKDRYAEWYKANGRNGREEPYTETHKANGHGMNGRKDPCTETHKANGEDGTGRVAPTTLERERGVGPGTDEKIWEITEEEPEIEIGETILSLLDTEPKVSKLARLNNARTQSSRLGSGVAQAMPAFRRSGKNGEADLVEGRSRFDVKPGLGADQGTLSSRSTSSLVETDSSDVKPFSGTTSRGSHWSTSSVTGTPSVRQEASLSTIENCVMASVGEGCERLADSQENGAAISSPGATSHRRSNVKGSYTSEWNLDPERGHGLPKLPFASVYTSPNSGKSLGRLWGKVRGRPDKTIIGSPERRRSDTSSVTETMQKHQEDLGYLSTGCFPRSSGR